MKTHLIDSILAAVIFAAGLGFFLLTGTHSAYPFGSSADLARHLGLTGFVPLDHPLWGAIIRFLASDSGDSMQRLTLFNACCGALCLVLVYSITMCFAHTRSREERSSGGSLVVARRVSGVFAAAFLAVSVPFWIASTRIYHFTFDILLLLICIRLAILAYQSKHKWTIMPASLLWGAGIAEFATFIPLTPLFLLYALGFTYITRRKISFETLARIFACMAIGVSLYWYTAYTAWQHPSARWMGMESYFDVFTSLLKTQKQLLVGLIPKTGWLLILLTSVLPLLIVLIPKTTDKKRNAWGSVCLHVVCSGIAVLLMGDSFISPWGQFKFFPFVVTPIVIASIWAGYLVGYWYMVFRNVPGRDNALRRMFRTFFKVLWFPVVPGIIMVSFILNGPIADGRFAGFVDRWTDEILDDMGDREWLYSNIGLEDVIMVKAHMRGQDVKVISPASSTRSAYRWYISTLFEDPRLKGLARISLPALFHEWLKADPTAHEEVAVTWLSDYWHVGGYDPIPTFNFYRGQVADQETDVEALFAELKPRFDGMQIDALNVLAESRNPLSSLAAFNLQLKSKQANNFGVICEERRDFAKAAYAYRTAREIDPENVSALLNLFELARKHSLHDAEQIGYDYAEFQNELSGKMMLWSLSRRYGYVHHANAYLDRGMSWAMSGKPRLAIQEMKRAMEVAGDDDRMKLTLAHLYFSGGERQESEAVYLEVLENDPTNRGALIGLARNSTLKSDFESAHSYLGRAMELAEEDDTRLLVEKFAILYMQGEIKLAKEALDEVVKIEPDNMKAWTALAVLAIQAEDDKAFYAIAKKIRRSRLLEDPVRIVFAQMLSSRGEYAEARKMLETILLRRPGNVKVLEHLLRIDVRERDKTRAQDRVTRLLESDPSNPYGNLVLGTLQFAGGQLLAAEGSFKASLEAERTAEALNSLAFTLVTMNRHGDALPPATEALEFAPDDPSSWDTMAMVRLGLRDYDNAQQAITRALALQPNNKVFLFHQALIFEKRGMGEQALKIAEDLFSDLAKFPSNLQGELEDLLFRLRRE